MEEGTSDPPGVSDNAPAPEMEETKPKKHRKPLISPSSSFVDFVELKTDVYSEEDRANAHLYDLTKDRKIRKPITNFHTCVHLLKGCIGAGVLALPHAFSKAGYALAVPGTFLLGFLAIYGVHTVISMRRIQCQRLKVPFLTLPRSLKVSFANGPPCLRKFTNIAPYIVDICLVGNQIGLCSVYVLLIARCLREVLEATLLKSEKDEATEDKVYRIYVAALFIPVLFITYIRNLRKMAPISLMADIFMATAFGICFYYIFGTGPIDPKKSGAKVVASSILTIPVFLTNIFFAYEAIGVMVTLEHNMKEPQRFLGVKGFFPWCMSIIAILYVIMGLSGYLKYGKHVEEKGGSTIMNLLPKGKGDIAAHTVRILIAVAIYGSYPLQLYVGLEIIWGNYLIHYIKESQNESLFEYGLRTAVVIFTFMLALITFRVENLITLVGALSLANLGLIMPFFMELCTKWPDQLGRYKIVLVKDIAIILFGVFVLITGTTFAMFDIVESFGEE